MRCIKNLLIIFISLVFVNEISSQKKDDTKVVNYQTSTLFKSDEPINLELHLNRKALLKDVKENSHYHYVLVKYQTEAEGEKEFGFKISTRGHFRKDPRNCNMPPLKLKIPKEISQATNIFSGQDKLKLVVPCMVDNDKYQQNLFLEYLIYRTYEVFTDAGFKTRLVNVSMIDSANAKQSQEFTGFFIEENDQLAARKEGKILEFKRYHPGNVNRDQMTFMAVFQYMVGNTDWSVDVSHNVELLFIQNNTIPLAVPYDFDWSGLVNAPYAVPSEVLNISSVTQRLFRGYERSMEEYVPVIKLFNDKKEEIYNLYKNCVYLTDKTKSSVIKYLDEFYKIINDPKVVDREFIKNCRKL